MGWQGSIHQTDAVVRWIYDRHKFSEFSEPDARCVVVLKGKKGSLEYRCPV